MYMRTDEFELLLNCIFNCPVPEGKSGKAQEFGVLEERFRIEGFMDMISRD